MQSTSFSFNKQEQPAYYHRQFEHDLSSTKTEEESYLKRVMLVSLPFFALYKPLGGMLSLSMDSFRSIASLSELSDTYTQGNTLKIAKSGLQVIVAVMALGTTLLAHPIGLFVTTGHDLMLNSFDGIKALHAGEYKQALEYTGQFANSGIYFAMLATNSLGLVVLSLAVQVAIEGYKSTDEFNKERYLEVCGHLVMACIRTSQLKSQYNLIQPQNDVKRKEIFTPEEDSKTFPNQTTNETFIQQINEAISNEDLEAFTQFQQSNEWNNLSQNDLRRLNYTLNMKCFVYNQINRNQTGLVMLEAIALNHPNSDLSVKRLSKLLRNACTYGNTDLFNFLLEKHPAKNDLIDKHLLKMLTSLSDSFCSPGGIVPDDLYPRGMEGKGEILKTLIRLPQWNRNSPHFLEKAFSSLTGGFIPQTIRIDVIKDFEKYPSWVGLDENMLAKIAFETTNHFIRDCEMPKFIFNLLSRNSSWRKITRDNLAKITESISYLPDDGKMDIFDLVTKHPQWNALTPSHLCTIAEDLCISARCHMNNLFNLLFDHPNWQKITSQRFCDFLHTFIHDKVNRDVALENILTHPSWLNFGRKELTDLAETAANSENIKFLKVLADHPSWPSLKKTDLLEIIEWSDWVSKFDRIMDIISSHPAWD